MNGMMSDIQCVRCSVWTRWSAVQFPIYWNAL